MKRNLQLRLNAVNARVAAKAAAILGGFSALVSQAAHAAIDTSAATTGITEASTAVLAVIAAMITMAVAVWGVKKVLKFFRG